MLGPIATLAVYDIGARLAGRLAGLWCAAAFVAAPFAAIPYFIQRYHDSWVDQFLPQALGLTQQADFPSVVAVLLSAALTVRALEAGAQREAVLAGTFAGVALGAEARQRAVPRRAAARVPARPSLRPHACSSPSRSARRSSRSRSGSPRVSARCPLFAQGEVAARRGARRPRRGVGNVVVRPHRSSELRHLEAEHVQPARVHLERAGRPVPPARRSDRGRAPLRPGGRPLPRLAARLRRRQGRRVGRHDRVGQLLEARDARASRVRAPDGGDPAARPDTGRARGAPARAASGPQARSSSRRSPSSRSSRWSRSPSFSCPARCGPWNSPLRREGSSPGR